jgi:hypothetical protein
MVAQSLGVQNDGLAEHPSLHTETVVPQIQNKMDTLAVELHNPVEILLVQARMVEAGTAGCAG